MTEEKKDFKVEDKRSYVRDDSGDFVKRKNEEPQPEETPQQTAEEKPPESDGPGEDKIPLPELNFPTFILSLHTSALMHLGMLPDPSNPDANAPTNLPLASQTIDLIAMLKEKTQGNLNEHETQMMEQVLYDLRMKYVQAQKGVKAD